MRKTVMVPHPLPARMLLQMDNRYLLDAKEGLETSHSTHLADYLQAIVSNNGEIMKNDAV
jgi:hypothetical protein